MNHEDKVCVVCGSSKVYAVDKEYDEGYCEQHFDEQQASTEPIPNYQTLYLREGHNG